MQNDDSVMSDEPLIIPYPRKKERQPLVVPPFRLNTMKGLRKLSSWIALEILRSDADDVNRINQLSKAGFVVNVTRGFLDAELTEKLLLKVEKLEIERGLK